MKTHMFWCNSHLTDYLWLNDFLSRDEDDAPTALVQSSGERRATAGHNLSKGHLSPAKLVLRGNIFVFIIPIKNMELQYLQKQQR